MRVSMATLAVLVICISLVQVAFTCTHGDIKGQCDTGPCCPDNMCRLCQCWRGAWDCSYGGSGSCGAGGKYYELGVHENSKYIYSMSRKSFSDAKTACSELGGALATFDTTAEHTAVNSFIDQGPKWMESSDILIGALNSGNGWKWVDDSDIDQTLFPQSYRWPHNSWWSRTTFFGEGPHCLVIQPWVNSAKNQWDPTRCAYRNYFMCKLPKSAVVPTYTGPEGPQDLGSFESKIYSVVKLEKSWDALQRDCKEQGGDLAVAHSQAVWTFLLKAVKDAGIEREVFLGASARSGTDSAWQWVDGQALAKDDDRWDYPHPIHVGRSCLLMVQGRQAGQAGYFRDTDCTYSHLGVCEKPLPS